MNILKFAIPIALLNITGCATIVDYDGEFSDVEQRQALEDGGVIYTEDIVNLADEEDIVIVASKSDTITFESDYEVKQDTWDIDAHNMGSKNQCVTLVWRLMDFKFVSDHPDEFYSPANSIVRVGTMTQMVWEIDGVKFAPDGSGYLYGMRVREPVKDAATGDECLHLIKDEDLVKEKDVYTQ